MARLRKSLKRFERHILLGLVILLLATFSVTGALKCGGGAPGPTYQLGGSFQVAPGERLEISDEEYDERYEEYKRLMRGLRLPTLEFWRFFGGARSPDPWKGAWLHIIGVEVARRAGYEVGPHQASKAARLMAEIKLRADSRLPFTESNYQQFLRQQFGGSVTEWERLVGQTVLKDMALAPVIEAARYTLSYPEAYEAWKSERERVNLATVALPGEGFADRVRAEETTRETLSRQEAVLDKLRTALDQLRGAVAAVEDYRARHEGQWPSAFGDLGSAAVPYRVPVDPWGEELRYERTEAAGDVRGAGPDGSFGTADDVTRELLAVYDAHVVLSRLGGELRRYRIGTGAWPTELARLREPLGPGKPALLLQPVLDPWGREPAYTPGPTPQDAPTLTVLGPDGEADTADDLVLVPDLKGEPDATPVPLQGPLGAFLLADLHDAWGRPIGARLARANPPAFGVVSAGLDGEPGTDDDLKEGNARELQAFYTGVARDYTREPRHDFEVLFVHTPLVPDDILARLWEAYPEQRPTDEAQAYQWWLNYRGKDVFYQADDPADPETGHGAALMKKIAPDAAVTLVPAREIFTGVTPMEEPAGGGPGPGQPGAEDGEDAPAPGRGDGEDDPAPDGDEPAPGEGEDEEDSDAALLREFRERGWREVVLREIFLERLLDHWLKKAMAAEEARGRTAKEREAYEQALARWQEEHGDKPEADRPPPPAEPAPPEEVTFQTLLAGEIKPFLLATNRDTSYVAETFQYWRPEQPATRAEWEANPDIGQPMLGQSLNSLDADGKYYRIPVQLNNRLTKVLLRRRGFIPSYQPTLEEIREELRPAWWRKRQLDHAEKALDRLRRSIQEAEAKAGDAATEEGREARAAAGRAALEEWARDLGLPHHLEETGWFIGSRPPVAVPVPEGAPAEEAGRIRRRNYVWRTGYATVAPTPSAQDHVTAEPGTFGRTVLTDRSTGPDGTGAAYLVRVKDRRFATPAEFSPRRYTTVVREHAFGDPMMPTRNVRLTDREGAFYRALALYMDDLDRLQTVFDLVTNSELHTLEDRQRR